jgi:hypothetical protein
MKPSLLTGCALTLNHIHFCVEVLFWHFANTPRLCYSISIVNHITSTGISISIIINDFNS